jgi:ribosomal protein S18 acetylase RimI-like enzyme
MKNSSMQIRKATVSDAQPIAQCLLMAMEDLVYEFIGFRDPEKALDFMFHFTQQKMNQYSFENCWVACNENQVVAAVNVYNGAKLHQLRQPVLDYLTLNYKRNFVPEDETQEGEYYIDTLGVLPEFRSKGIGSGLLQFLISKYVEKQGKTLGLLVDCDNPKAKQLYLKLSFKTVGYKTLMSKTMEHLQRDAIEH